ncbi:MAG: peptidase S8/S53 subtilisin kexin sedolisin, partial [uncultured bacterium]
GTYTSGTAWILDTGVSTTTGDLNVDTTNAAYFIGDSFEDDNRHGTHKAGIIAAIDNDVGVVGVAPGAPVVPVKVCDSEGTCPAGCVLRGFNHIATYAEVGDVVNISLTADFVGDGRLEELLRRAISMAILRSDGANYVTGSGNNGECLDKMREELLPASMNKLHLTTVTAYNEDGTFRSRSNYGSAIDFAAPGQNIESLDIDGGMYTTDGTSSATAFVSGIFLVQGFVSSDGTVTDPDGVDISKAHLE